MRACELHPETCDSGVHLRQLPLAGIAPERTRGPERVGGVDPVGFWGFLHLSLHVWVDLRGRGRQLRACHGSLPPRVLQYLQQRAANMLPPPGVRADRLPQRKPALPVSLVPLAGGGGAPAFLPHHGLLGHTEASIQRSSIPDEDIRSPVLLRSTRRHDVTSTARPTQRFQNGLHNRQRNDSRVILILIDTVLAGTTILFFFFF